MRSGNDERREDPGRAAAEWFVERDAGGLEPRREAMLDDWLARSPAHREALERCDAVVALAALLGEDEVRALAVDGESRTRARLRAFGERMLALYRRPALAWSVAAASMLSAGLLGVSRFEPDAVAGDGGAAGGFPQPRITIDERGPAAPRASGADTMLGPEGRRFASSGAPGAASVPAGASLSSDAGPAAVSADRPATGPEPSRASPARGTIWLDRALPDPTALLPGDLVVDARSLAVLPFDAAASGPPGADSAEATEIAARLYDAVFAQLASLPGFYVAQRAAAEVYAGREHMPAEVAAQLGVRSVVEGELTFADESVLVMLRVTDASGGGRSYVTSIERPMHELTAVRSEIVTSIATAMASTP